MNRSTRLILLLMLFSMLCLLGSASLAFGQVTVNAGTESALIAELAAAALRADDTVINLTADIPLTAALTVAPNGGGFAVYLSGGGRLTGPNGVDAVIVNGNLILWNVTITHNTGQQGRGVVVNPSGHLTIANVASVSGNTKSAASNNQGAGVYVNGGQLAMSGGVVSRNSSSGGQAYGGGIYIGNGGSFTMSGGTVSFNSTDASGGGVLIENGTFTMTGGEISQNESNYGGGVSLFSDATMTMSGGDIGKNEAFALGAGIHVYVRSSLTMNAGSRVLLNTGTSTSSAGGGVQLTTTASFTMNGGEISGNSAYYGAGVDSNGTFVMNGGEVSGNVASARGGGIQAEFGTMTIDGGTISGNTASGNGGGLYIGSLCTVNLIDGLIFNNRAQSGAGVMYNGNNVDFTMSGGEIYGNIASADGGGVNANGRNFIMLGGSIYGNSADEFGDGVYYRSGKVTVGGAPQVGSATDTNAITRGTVNNVIAIVDTGLASGAYLNITAISTGSPRDQLGTVIATKQNTVAVSDAEAALFHYRGVFTSIADGANVILGEIPATVPGPPQNFTAVPGDGRVALSWTATLSDGGSPILYYEVRINGGAWVRASSDTVHLFTGLTNGVTYTFEVRAVNAIGAGPAAQTEGTPVKSGGGGGNGGGGNNGSDGKKPGKLPQAGDGSAGMLAMVSLIGLAGCSLTSVASYRKRHLNR